MQVDRQVEQIQQMFNMDKDQTSLQIPLIDVDQVGQSVSPIEVREKFKLIEGKNGPTAFLPLGSKLGEENSNRKINKGENTDKRYQTAIHGNYIYRKVQLGNLFNKNMMRQEIDQDIELDKMDNTNGEENWYRELIVNNVGKIETTLSQMEQ